MSAAHITTEEAKKTKAEDTPGYSNPKRLGPVRVFGLSILLFLVWLTKPFKFLQRFLPYKARELNRAWNTRMIWTFILTQGRKVYIGQCCKLNDPPTYEPLIQTKPEWQLTEQEIRDFYRDGFSKPITLWTPEEMVEIRRRVSQVLTSTSKVYPDVKNKLRDRYIDRPDFWDVISSPQIVERLAQFLGPDLVVWRSQIFNKEPGAPEIAWHQATTYMADQMIKPALEPPDLNELFQLTVWIAIDDATFENGCMHFLKGTHRKIVPILRTATEMKGNPPEIAKVIAGQGRFAHAKIFLDLDITPDMIVPMPLKAGQCVIFMERCIHGSPPNISNNRRFGFVFRTVKTNVRVYREETIHEVGYLKERYDLKNWGCALLRGEDKYHLNRMIQPPTPDREFVGAGQSSAAD